MESLAISKKHNYIGDFNRLIASLQSENEAEFLQGIESFAKNNSDQLPGIFQTTDTNGSLLTLACEKGLVQAVQVLLRLGANIDAVIHTRRGLWNAVEVTCQFGNWEVLEILLKSPKLDLSKSRSILSSVVRNIDEKETPKCNYKKCFQLLLDHKDIDVNQLNAYGFSPLHYAVRFNNSDAIVELMKHGAYIGQKNKFNRYAISNIKPDLLKKHFDSCITTNNLRIGDDHFEIQFDYSSLVPVPTRKQNDKKSTAEYEMSSDCCPNEMTAIEYMSESNKHRHLLNHPLIRSFLFLKWNQFAFVFYMNFILSLLFALSTASFIFFCYLDGRKNVGIRYTILQIVTFLLTFYMMVREMSQFALSPLAFLRRAVNYMELVMIILVLIVLFDPDKENRPIFAASLLVLVGIEVFHLAGSLPFGSFSIHYVMLKKLISSCVKTFSHYVIPIMIFSLAFYILVRGNPQLITEAGKLPKEFKEIPGEFKSFAKLISMMIATTSGVGVTLLSCFFFISFITPTVFLNLLNGLAVIDIKNIKSEAELTNLIHRCEVLSRYEKTLLDNQHWFR